VTNFIVEDSALITMNDGAKISAVIVRRKDMTTPQPVVLVYDIYAGPVDIGRAEEIAVHGFIGVVVDTRGKRLSPQQIEPFEHDAKDAYQIIDWISKQPWCNGKVGMFGGSYLGFSQWAAVKHLNPALKTIVPQVAVGAGIDYPVHNGIFMSFMLRWIHYVTNNKMTDEDEFGNQDKWDSLFTKWYKSGASFRSLDTLDSRPNFIFQRWLKHPTYDSYWQSMTPQKEEFAKINIPILTITGYYDDDQLGALYYYRQHHLWNKQANKNHYLLIGPFDHAGSQAYPRSILTNYKIDSLANISINDIVFDWFNYVLKDSSKPAILKDYVNFEVMGKNEWRHVASLDKMNNDTLTFYLSTSKDVSRYKLASSKPLKIGYINQEVDFSDRHEIKLDAEDVGWVTAIIDSVLVPSQNELVFITDPLKERFSINGSIMANIIASINKKDMDIVLDFYEQMPDGKYFALNRCLQRASYAKDRTKRQLLHPGKIEHIEMNNTFFTSRQLQKGSRLVIMIGINKSPSWQINYGTGKDVSDETIDDAKKPLVIKWYNNSSIKIPVWKE
ncbi:MAG: CocE/NonD family hydrolase, partial [Ginsengibacter sp.]